MIRYGKNKLKRILSRNLPLVLTITAHGLLLLLFLLSKPFGRFTKNKADNLFVNTELLQFEGEGKSGEPSAPEQVSKSIPLKTETHTTETAAQDNESVNLNETNKPLPESVIANTDSVSKNVSASDTLNYMSLFGKEGGTGNGGSGGSGVSGGNMKLPTFMGGDFNNFRVWFLKRFRLPVDAPVGYKERVVVSFSVDNNGIMRNIRVRSCSSPEVEKEIKRVLNNAPSWTPGIFNGRPASFNLQMPVNFKGY